MKTEETDEMDNNIMAAGGVFAALGQAGVPAQPVMDGINVTNMIDVSLHFMKSRYRLTVERIPDEDEQQ